MKHTPLHEEHVKLKALMASFAGWDMPIHYGSIIEEAKHTRSAVSVFDVSHMGEFMVSEKPGNASLDRAVTIPVLAMKHYRCRYGFLLDEYGMVLDDLIAYRVADDRWMLVVNAATLNRDLSVIQQRLDRDASIENISDRTVKIDIQGPRSLAIMKEFAGDAVKKLPYFGFEYFNLLGGQCIISRSGYTGELGFEIYIDSGKGGLLWRELLKHPEVKPAGLGARDILRTEMGYPLYGNELTEDTTPLDRGLERFLYMDKDFTGKQALLEQQKQGVKKMLIAFTARGRRTPRHENKIFFQKREAGCVTSGVFSPHLNRGIGMGYVEADIGKAAEEISIDAGREDIIADIVTVPFLKNTSIHHREA